jgi:hypothetical protein
MISVNDEFYAWLTGEAESIGIPSATMATILLNEAKKAREVQECRQQASDKIKEQFAKLFESGFESSFKKKTEAIEHDLDQEKETHEVQTSIPTANDKLKEQFNEVV